MKQRCINGKNDHCALMVALVREASADWIFHSNSPEISSHFYTLFFTYSFILIVYSFWENANVTLKTYFDFKLWACYVSWSEMENLMLLKRIMQIFSLHWHKNKSLLCPDCLMGWEWAPGSQEESVKCSCSVVDSHPAHFSVHSFIHESFFKQSLVFKTELFHA